MSPRWAAASVRELLLRRLVSFPGGRAARLCNLQGSEGRRAPQKANKHGRNLARPAFKFNLTVPAAGAEGAAREGTRERRTRYVGGE